MNNLSSDLGEIKIHKRLISQVAQIAALKVEGVSCIATTSQRLISKILEKLNLPINIKIDLSKGPKIEIPVIIKYNYNIPEVALKIQEEILKDLNKILNIDSAYIIVKVKGIERIEHNQKEDL